MISIENIMKIKRIKSVSSRGPRQKLLAEFLPGHRLWFLRKEQAVPSLSGTTSSCLGLYIVFGLWILSEMRAVPPN
jgi:hypothetical protein